MSRSIARPRSSPFPAFPPVGISASLRVPARTRRNGLTGEITRPPPGHTVQPGDRPQMPEEWLTYREIGSRLGVKLRLSAPASGLPA
jgi:hypothetical protein